MWSPKISHGVLFPIKTYTSFIHNNFKLSVFYICCGSLCCAFLSSLGSHPLCSSSQSFIRLVNWEPALFGIPETLYRCIWVLLKGSLLSSLEQLDRSSGKTPELVIWGWRRGGGRGWVRVNEGREERSQLHVKSLRPKQLDRIVEQETGHFGHFSVDKGSCREDILTRHCGHLRPGWQRTCWYDEARMWLIM